MNDDDDDADDAVLLLAEALDQMERLPVVLLERLLVGDSDPWLRLRSLVARLDDTPVRRRRYQRLLRAATAVPGFWRAWVTRCFPGVTTLPDDQRLTWTDVTQPASVVDEAWRQLARRCVACVSTLTLAIERRGAGYRDDRSVGNTRLAPTLGRSAAFRLQLQSAATCRQLFDRTYRFVATPATARPSDRLRLAVRSEDALVAGSIDFVDDPLRGGASESSVVDDRWQLAWSARVERVDEQLQEADYMTSVDWEASDDDDAIDDGVFYSLERRVVREKWRIVEAVAQVRVRPRTFVDDWLFADIVDAHWERAGDPVPFVGFATDPGPLVDELDVGDTRPPTNR